MELVFCVFACDTVPKYKNEILKIQETWGKKCLEYPSVKLLFMLGEEKTDLIGDCYINLPGVQNDYLSASYKQFIGLQYIQDNFPCDFVFICGSDTYVNIPSLLQYIRQFNPLDKLYIGGHGDLRTIENRTVYFHSGGCGIILSRACQKALLPFLPTIMENWIPLCYNVPNLIAACDVALAYYLQLKIGVEVIINKENRFIHCNHWGMNHGDICYGTKTFHHYTICQNNLISCHNMTMNDFDQFTTILEANNWFQ